MVAHYIQEQGGIVTDLNDDNICVILRVHEKDKIKPKDFVTVLDPWRSYKTDNDTVKVIHYGNTRTA